MSMEELLSKIVIAVVGGAIGVAGTVWTAKRRENISTRKEQLHYFYAPMEILLRMNAKSFERYKSAERKSHDREYIEKNIWYPNHVKTKELIMTQSHHLTSMPDEILDLLEHIDVWLSEYELIHIKKEKTGPVYAGPKGTKYPNASNKFVFNTAARLRKELNKS